jgi:hypothetical protein
MTLTALPAFASFYATGGVTVLSLRNPFLASLTNKFAMVKITNAVDMQGLRTAT